MTGRLPSALNAFLDEFVDSTLHIEVNNLHEIALERNFAGINLRFWNGEPQAKIIEIPLQFITKPIPSHKIDLLVSHGIKIGMYDGTNIGTTALSVFNQAVLTQNTKLGQAL
jgi:hypothetical protein